MISRGRLASALVLAGGSLAACSDHAIDEPDLMRVALPGFSIELPAGRVIADSNEAFAGQYRVQLADPGFLRRLPLATHRRREAIVNVSWGQHSLDDQEYIATLRDMALGTIPDGKILREATPVPGSWVLTVGGSGASVTYASRSCEPGFSIDLTVGVNTRADEDFGLASKILETIVCNLSDANRRRPEPATRLPGNFGRVIGAKNPRFVSLKGEILVISMTSGDMAGSEELETVMKAVVGQSFEVPSEQVSLAEIPSGGKDDRKHRLLRATVPSGQLHVGALWCPKLRITLMTTYTSLEPQDARAREVFDAVYCPGEPGEAAPDAKSMLEGACNGGDSLACQVLRETSF